MYIAFVRLLCILKVAHIVVSAKAVKCPVFDKQQRVPPKRFDLPRLTIHSGAIRSFEIVLRSTLNESGNATAQNENSQLKMKPIRGARHYSNNLGQREPESNPKKTYVLQQLTL
uniref:Putative secreted peptide n=1 Tax=Anopheles braziliensis TaxID=58242 RepID=A0A2M3ZMG5_9DIPT